MNNTMTIMGNNTTMTKCYANVGKNRTWFQRLKGYFLTMQIILQLLLLC